MKPTKYIWQNGKEVSWEHAKIHVLSHALHYGTGFFEGIRAYKTTRGTAIFRSFEHFRRLEESLHIYQLKAPYSANELRLAAKKLLLSNGLETAYIRPLVFAGYGVMGLNPEGAPMEAIIAAWEWGTYLGEEGLKNGIRCTISSWCRIDSRTLPSLSKCSANYANSVLAKREALQSGFDEAILLNSQGIVAEGPGENIFMIKNKKIYTPPLSDGVLGGITANSAIQIAEKLGYPIHYKSITRDELFTADELFFTGTAAEITPIKEIDGRVIGTGMPGEMTKSIQDKFFKIIQGKEPEYLHWLDFINEPN